MICPLCKTHEVVDLCEACVYDTKFLKEHEELQAELDSRKTQASGRERVIAELNVELRDTINHVVSLESRLVRMRDALEKYGRHLKECHDNVDGPGAGSENCMGGDLCGCDCGLQSALDEGKEDKPNKAGGVVK